jgi:predicted metalloprotease with PDZ domain
LLNYSIFGWIEGTEKEPVSCTVETIASWPIFTSTHPSVSLEKGRLKFNTADYYSLADGQIFIGNRFRVKKFEGLVPLFVASYSETNDEYLDDYGLQGTMSMGILKDYFGELPFREYSILLRNAIPSIPGNAPALAMEHLQSATFFGDTSGIRKKQMSKKELIASMPTYLHHMAHSLIPLRSYGDAYRPYVMEIPPIINNIWFNEGFMWFLPYDTLKLERMKKTFYDNVYNAAAIIKKMSLKELSQISSTMYGVDFRLGRAIYSRGAMMAIEMNAYLKEKTGGQKSMKDVLRFIYYWSKENKRPFTLEEFPLLINQASGIDLGEIYRKWQLPVE